MTRICLAALVCLVSVVILVSFTGTLLFGIGLQHVKEIQYIGGNVPILLYPTGFDQLFVKSVTVAGHVTRPEQGSEGTFFLTPCNSLLLSSRHFPNKSLGMFASPEPVPTNLNYFQTEEPIISQGLPGNLTYYTTAQSNQSYSKCPITISIFDNEKDYKNFRSGVSQTLTNQSDCLLQNFSSDQPPTTLTESNFVLLPGNFYFVVLSMQPGVEAFISVMFTVTEYTVSHLQPLSCGLKYQEAADDHCTFNLSNSSYQFLSHKECLIGHSFSNLSAPYFNVSLSTTANHLGTPYFVMFLTILVLICVVTIVSLCTVISLYLFLTMTVKLWLC